MNESIHQSLFIKMAIMAWETQNNRVTKLIDELPDEKLGTETAPGRNRGIYILGHLIAVSDGMLPLLELGEKQYPELQDLFLKAPDKTISELPSIAALKEKWTEINLILSDHFSSMQAEDWFKKHSAVSDQDFEKEPFRNKLNILINRTNHQSYHLGQLIYLK